MTERRQKLLDRFDKWLDSKPRKQIISAQCANIAEEYAEERLRLYGVSDSLQDDIRNKLSPLSNLIAMIEDDADMEWIKKQIPQAKISIEYLSNYR